MPKFQFDFPKVIKPNDFCIPTTLLQLEQLLEFDVDKKKILEILFAGYEIQSKRQKGLLNA